MSETTVAAKGYNPPNPNSARSQRKYQHDKAVRIEALPAEVKKLRLQIIQLKSRGCTLAKSIRTNRREIHRIGKDLKYTSDHPETQSLTFAISGHQRDRERSRRHARATHLAYGFIRGVPYNQIEATCYTYPRWNLVGKIIKDVCGNDPVMLQRFAAWSHESRVKEATERNERERQRRLRPAMLEVTPQANRAVQFASSDPSEPPTAA